MLPDGFTRRCGTLRLRPARCGRRAGERASHGARPASQPRAVQEAPAASPDPGPRRWAKRACTPAGAGTRHLSTNAPCFGPGTSSPAQPGRPGGCHDGHHAGLAARWTRGRIWCARGAASKAPHLSARRITRESDRCTRSRTGCDPATQTSPGNRCVLRPRRTPGDVAVSRKAVSRRAP